MTIPIQWPWPQTDVGTISDTAQAKYINALHGHGVTDPDRGVWRDVLNELKVNASTPAGKSVQVDTGVALIQGRMLYLSIAETLTIDDNVSGQPRIDLVVARYLSSNTAAPVSLYVVKGTPAASPEPPGLTQSDGVQWQIPLAEVYVANAFTTIVTSNITDRREWGNVPSALSLPVTNQSGAVRKNGELVVWNSGADQSITTSTTEADAAIAGIMETRTSIGGAGRITVMGIVPVLCDETVARGDLLEQSTTAGQAQKQKRPAKVAFGRVMVANSGAGSACLAYVNFLASHAETSEGYVEFRTSSGQTINSSSLTLVPFNTVVTDPLSFNEFNTGTNTWTPRVGTWLVNIQIAVTSGGYTTRLSVYRNNSFWYDLFNPNAATEFGGSFTMIINQTSASDAYKIYASGSVVADGSRWRAVRL